MTQTIEAQARVEAKRSLKSLAVVLTTSLLTFVFAAALTTAEAYAHGLTVRFAFFSIGIIISLGIMIDSLYGSFIIAYMRGRLDEALLVQEDLRKARNE